MLIHWLWAQVVRRPRRGPSAGGRRTTRIHVEELEARALLSTTTVAELVGRQYIHDHLDTISNVYNFSLTNAAALDVQASYPDPSAAAEFNLSVSPTDTSAVGGAVAGTGALHIPAPVDETSWQAEVAQFAGPASSNDYTLVLAADSAPGAQFDDGTNDYHADRGRDLGTLSAVNPITVTDFIGYLDTSAHDGKDLLDMYFFDAPDDGYLSINLDQLELDTAGGQQVGARWSLFERDPNNDRLNNLPIGVVGGDFVDAGEAFPGRGSISLAERLHPGEYAVLIRSSNSSTGLSGGSDYRLNLTYFPAVIHDRDTLATARDLGTLSSVQTHGYLSSADTSEFYRFATGSGGQFVLSGTLFRSSEQGVFALDFIQDKNANGVVDAGETLASGTDPFFKADVLAGALTAGTYYARVRRISGEGGYVLGLSIPDSGAGNTLATATNLGTLVGGTRVAGFVGSTNSVDIYKVTLASAATITASFPGTASGTNADLHLLNSSGAILESSTRSDNLGESLDRACAAGTYYVSVQRIAGSPFYTLTVAVDTAGATLAAARIVTLSQDPPFTNEFVGSGDSIDFYRVSLPSSSQLNVSFSKSVVQPLTLSVVRDVNDNGVVDVGEVIFSKSIAGPDDLHQALNLTSKGDTFYVEVAAAGSSTNYGLQFNTAPIDNAGDTAATARDVGVLGATRTFTDYVGDGSAFFADDTDDFYRFTLGDRGPYTFSASISGLTDNADIQLIRDDNHNLAVDDDDALAVSTNTGTATDTISRTLTIPGVYYVHVLRVSGSTNYTLTMSATSKDTAGNSLQTANQLGTLTTSVSREGFVGRIDHDDFYSFSVSGAGMLAVTLKSVPGPWVEVIDDTGKTLASSAAAQSDKLGVSLPAAGTYYARVATTVADANFGLTLSFTQKVGTFSLTPNRKTISVGDRVKLALDWTVPAGSWHTLQSVDLSLRNLDGTLALIRFYEANNSLSLFDAATGKFGPAVKLGSNAVLANRYLNIFLKTSTVKAASPASPTVTLTFDIQFKNSLPALPIVMEATATDDLGQTQDFGYAGTLDVVKQRCRRF